MKKCKKLMRQKGFTLIELMIVIAIIGILTAIIMANFAAARSRARDTQRISDLSQLQLAFAGYFDRCGQYPTPATYNIGPPSYSNEGIISSSMLSDSNGPCPSGITLATFISTIPNPPNFSSGERYVYYVDAHWDDYFMQTTLENSNLPSNNSLAPDPAWYAPAGIWLDYEYNAILPACSQTTTAYCVGPK